TCSPTSCTPTPTRASRPDQPEEDVQVEIRAADASGPATLDGLAPEAELATLRASVWRRFRRHRLAMAGLVGLATFCLAAIFAEWVGRRSPTFVDLDAIKTPPSRDHILGTDAAGRDVFARLVFAARISMSVGVIAVVISGAIGTTIGLVAGYAGG